MDKLILCIHVVFQLTLPRSYAYLWCSSSLCLVRVTCERADFVHICSAPAHFAYSIFPVAVDTYPPNPDPNWALFPNFANNMLFEYEMTLP